MSKEAIIKHLQWVVTVQSQAALSHKLQGKVFASQGFTKLGDKYEDHYIEEMDFVDQFIDRLLDLGAEVKNEAKEAQAIQTDIVAYLKEEVEDSKEGLAYLRQALEDAKDDVTSYDLLKAYYKDEEEDLYWSENQLELIERIGLQNWLTQQL